MSFQEEIEEFGDCEGNSGYIPNLIGGFMQKGRKRDVSKRDYT